MVASPSLEQAAAYPVPEDLYSCGPRIGFYFDSAWSSTERSTLRTGFHRWRTPKQKDGTPLTYTDELPYSDPQGRSLTGVVEVFRVTPPFGGSGFGVCDNVYAGMIQISPTATTNSDRLRYLATHEMGHNFGLGHTGDEDSFEEGRTGANYPPSMATCGGSGTSSSLLYGSQYEMDDEAAIHARHNFNLDVASRRVYNPNPNIERATKYWKVSDSSTLTARYNASVAANGNYRLEYRPFNVTNSFISQQVRVADHAPSVRVRFSFKTEGTVSTASNDVKTEVWTRPVSYSYPSSCAYPVDIENDTGLAYNYSSAGSYVRRIAATYNLSSSWASATTFAWSASSYAEDYQLRVYSNAKDSSGNKLYTYLDDVALVSA